MGSGALGAVVVILNKIFIGGRPGRVPWPTCQGA
jgi:hypothetical protein